ncbi:hypothetical protein HK098_003340 [Nowakowskiella sp. JEL0407]|nr:hypothetical protein HK098_003340 [Nowakowskiella sp. JEL0407]
MKFLNYIPIKPSWRLFVVLIQTLFISTLFFYLIYSWFDLYDEEEEYSREEFENVITPFKTHSQNPFEITTEVTTSTTTTTTTTTATSPSPSPRKKLIPYLPGPCLPSNNDHSHKDVDVSKFPEQEIATHREAWQTWLINEFPKLGTFDIASKTMEEAIPLPHKIAGTRGIAIVIGDPRHINFLNTSLIMLRKYGCKLPVEVWSFSHELNDNHRKEVLAHHTPDAPVYLRFADDETNYLPIERGSGNGYHVKVAVTVNAGFEHLLFLDVDTMVIRNPEFLFDSEEYFEYGAIFWPDYWKTHSFNPIWRWFGQPCVDEWEQESGVMVINRRAQWRALALLWFVNKDNKIRDWHQKFLHGDKDLFRFSFRAAGTPAYFVQHLVAPGGFMVPENRDGTGKMRFCGVAMMQHDFEGKVLFGHVNFFKQTNKRRFNSTNPPLKVVKSYVPLDNISDVGPVPGTKLAWSNTVGASAAFVGAGGYVCVDIGEGEEREGVRRKTHIKPIADVNKDFENDLFDLLVKDWVAIDQKGYEEEQERKKKEEERKKQEEEERIKKEKEKQAEEERIKKEKQAEEERIKKEKEKQAEEERLKKEKENQAEEERVKKEKETQETSKLKSEEEGKQATDLDVISETSATDLKPTESARKD